MPNPPASVRRTEVGNEAHSLAQALLAEARFGYVCKLSIDELGPLKA